MDLLNPEVNEPIFLIEIALASNPEMTNTTPKETTIDSVEMLQKLVCVAL